jgi:hypothetical protein
MMALHLHAVFFMALDIISILEQHLKDLCSQNRNYLCVQLFLGTSRVGVVCTALWSVITSQCGLQPCSCTRRRMGGVWPNAQRPQI